MYRKTDRQTVRAAIALESPSLREAGFTGSRGRTEEARDCRKQLEREQEELIGRISEAIGRPLDVAHRFTRNVNVISANVYPEELELIRGLEGVKNVSRERLNHPTAILPGRSDR